MSVQIGTGKLSKKDLEKIIMEISKVVVNGTRDIHVGRNPPAEKKEGMIWYNVDEKRFYALAT